MSPQELLNKHGIALDDYKSGQHYATCPQCSASRKKASDKCLGVMIESGESGERVCWHCCHCEWSGPEKGRSNGGDPSEHPTYIYRAADGTPAFRKVRGFDKNGEKFFWIERADDKGGWIKGTKDKSGKRLVDTSIIYRLDEVKKAIAAGRVIACVEGEKDADNLWSLGIAATCNAHGASEPSKKAKWTKAHSEQLRGADIVVLNDNDPAGYEHADTTCKLSLGVAKRVRRLDLAPHWPDMPKGADISDWLVLGHTREELDVLIEQAPLVEAEPATEPPKEPEPTDADVEITRLAKLKLVEYEQQRKAAADKLGVRASMLDKVVQAERARLGLDADDSKQGRAIEFPKPEPWPEPVDGAELLDGIASAVRNHVVMSDHCRDTTALWTLHTYPIDCFLVSPRLGVLSPTKQCGKTTLFDVLGRLVLRPLSTQNVTPAVIFRVIEAHRPTLFIDEGDTFLYDNDELRGVLNGNRKGSTVLRTVGDDYEPRAFSVYSAVAIALIGTLPDTLHDRSVIVDLKRRLPSEKIEPFRPDRADHLDVLARKAVRWAQDNAERIAAIDPVMPDGIINREADNWRPLLAIAEVAGGEWPERVRKAAEASHHAGGDEASRLELLLGDIRDIRDEKDLTQIPSGDLVQALVDKDGRPWAEMGKTGKPLTQAKLARMLKPVRIPSQKIMVPHKGGITGREINKEVRGYVFADFEEAFERYLPPKGDSKCRSVANPINTGTSDDSKVSEPEDRPTLSKREKSNNDGLSDTSTLSKGGSSGFAQVRTKSKSDDLPYTGPPVPVPDMGPDSLDGHGAPLAAREPGLSTRTIRGVADEYTERGYANMQATNGDTHTAELDAWLRLRLGELGVRPEHVETEFARVKAVVFGGV
jgi:putative DNA primase/helicase